MLESEKTRAQLSDTEEKYRIADGDLKDTTTRYEGIKEEYDRIATQIEALERQMEQARAQLTDTSVLRGKLEGEIAVLQEKSVPSGAMKHICRAEKRRCARRLTHETPTKKAAAAAKRDSKTARKAAGRAQQRCSRTGNHPEPGRRFKPVDRRCQNAIIDTLNDRAAIKTKMGRQDTMLEQAQIRRAELNSRLLRVKSDEVQQEESIKSLEEAFNTVTQEIASRKEAQTAMEAKLNEFRETIAKMDQALRDAQVQYHQDKTRLEAVSNLTERYEGYGGSIRRVMEQKDKNPGIIGVVADIIKVEKKYETAIETALGGSIQNIVTDNEETAKGMISFLKQTKSGRATFLPLNSIKNAQEFRQKEALKEPGVLGLAHTLVHTDEKYSDVAKSLLGRIVVVDHVDHATQLARKFKYSLRIVTLEGESLSPGGSISGGAFKNSSNLLGRRREMEELEWKVKAHAKAVDELLVSIEDLKKTGTNAGQSWKRAALRCKTPLSARILPA